MKYSGHDGGEGRPERTKGCKLKGETWPSAAWASTREAPGISSLLHAPHEYTSLGTVLPFHCGPRRYEGIKRKRLVLDCRIRPRASFLSRVVCLSPLAMILLTGELFSNNLYACSCWCFASLVFSLADFPLLWSNPFIHPVPLDEVQVKRETQHKSFT